MTPFQILIKQTESAYNWTFKLFDAVPESKWDVLAPGLETSLSWQLGHQVISIYYHTVMTTVGHVGELLEQLNLKQYTERCGYGTQARDMAGTYSSKQLRDDLKYMQDASLELIGSLKEEALWEPVRSMKVPHPVATTKFEAIDWNVKHTLWHCGQIAIWKRMVDQPHDFGLKT